jgi:aminopeptidase
MHLALGKSYHDAYRGNPRRLGEKGLERLGFNHSPEHVDIIASSERTVDAELEDGSRKTIYEDGRFTL